MVRAGPLAKTGRAPAGGRWPQRLVLQVPPLRPAPGGTGGEGHGQEVGVPGSGLGQPPGPPHLVPPADAPSTHWAPRDPNKEDQLGDKGRTRGQMLTDIVSGSGRGSRAGPQKGRGGAGKGPGLHMPPLFRATVFLRERGPPGHCPGHIGRVTHQMAVCCVSQLSGAE